MREKYFMRKEWDDDLLLGITYDDERRRVTIGGSCRFIDTMQSVLQRFGGEAEPTIRKHYRSHRTKVSVDGVDPETWKAGIAALRDEQWQLRETRSFRRLMT